MSITIVLRSVAGPDAGWSIRLSPGFHWLGRVPGGVEIHDPTVEVHHALVEVDDQGRAALLQTTGRVPARVGGVPASGWVALPAGAVVDVGHTRLLIDAADPSPPPTGWVYAPLDEGPVEIARFVRDAARAAAAGRARSVHRTPTTVVLGECESAMSIDVRDRRGRPIEVLSDVAHSALVGATTSCSSLEIDLADHRRLAVVAADPVGIADALLAQLSAAERAMFVVAWTLDADVLADIERPLIVLADEVDRVPAWCRSMLEVGTTWQGRWTPDVGRPEQFARLHARGISRRRPRAGAGDGCDRLARQGEPTPGGRSSLSR